MEGSYAFATGAAVTGPKVIKNGTHCRACSIGLPSMSTSLVAGLTDAEVAQRVAAGKTNDVPVRICSFPPGC